MNEEELLKEVERIESTLSPQKAQRELRKIGKRRCCFCKEVFNLESFGKNEEGYRRSCKKCESNRNRKKWGEKRLTQTLEEAIRYKFYQASYRSKEKGRIFGLTVEDVKKQWEFQNGLCFYTGVEMEILPNNLNHFSIDRIDSLEGYSPENIVLCTHVINMMKRDIPHDVFVEYCAMVVSHCHKMGR